MPMLEGGDPRNPMMERMARGEVATTMIVRLVESPAIATIAASCGFDGLFIDLEHGPYSVETANRLSLACLSAGVTPLVRVPAGRPDLVGRVLDGGALGVVIPHVETADEARAAVRLARYPPEGERSASGVLPQFGFRAMPPDRAPDALNRATLVVAMVESEAALGRVDEIAEVAGIDVILIGTTDLLSEQGAPGQFDHPITMDAYDKAIEAARRHGKQVGIGGLTSRPDLIAGIVAAGARYVSLAADIHYLMEAAARQAAEVRAIATGS